MRKGDETKTRRASRREKTAGNQFSEMPEDIDDDWYEEPDFDIGDLTSALLPPSPHKLTARRRLDRFLEQRRLDLDLRDMLEDEDDDDEGGHTRRRPRHRRHRSKHKPLVDA